jgi:hypothetical protein
VRDSHSAVAAIAARQHALFTRQQAFTAGLSRHGLEHGAAKGRYDRLGRGLYRMAGTLASWEQQVLAAVLGGGDGALASHRSAAALWNLDGYRRGPVDISVPRHRRSWGQSGVLVHESTDLELAEPTKRQGVPVTGIVRTLIDLGCVVSEKRLLQAVDDAIRRRLTTWQQIAAMRGRHSRKGRNGVGKMRELLAERYGTTIPDSHFGRLVADLLVDAGLPTPVIEHNVYTENGLWLARVDLAYPDRLVAIELDSKKHHLHEEAFEKDRPRRNRVELAGWLVLNYTWQFYSRHPTQLCAEVAEAIRL